MLLPSAKATICPSAPSCVAAPCVCSHSHSNDTTFPDRLGKVGATQLRSLLVELAVAPWATLDGEEYSPAVKVLSKAYGVSLADTEKAVEASTAAEGLFEKV